MASSPKSLNKLASAGSFRSLLGTKGETEEERMRRLEFKYGKELHEAFSRKDKLRKEKKVKNWMELFVLLSENHPKAAAMDSGGVTPIQTVNGRVEPLIAAGLVNDPMQMYRQNLANIKAKGGVVNISREDREACERWLGESLELERNRLSVLINAAETKDDSAIKEQQTKIADLQQQVEELRAVEVATKGVTLKLQVPASFYEKRDRARDEKVMVAVSSAFALFAFFAMFFIMYFLRT